MSDLKNLQEIYTVKGLHYNNKVEIVGRKRSRKMEKEKVKRILLNYCKSTAMHGFRYIADDLPIMEKYIWFAILVIASIFCMILIWVSNTNIQNRLPSIKMADNGAPLYTINYPAITICSYNKVYKEATIPLQHSLSNAGYDNETIDSFFRNLSLLVRPVIDTFQPQLMNKMLYSLDNSLKNLMRQLMQPCNKLLKTCFWLGKSYDCNLIFKVVDSFHGHCCAFNYHVANTYADENHSSECEEYYDKYDNDKNIPCDEPSDCPGRKEILKVPGSGIDAGLIVDIDVEEDMYEGSTRDFAGASVIIHKPQDFPETDILTATIQPDQQTNIAVSATEVMSLNEIRIYSPSERKCVFEDEIKFEYSYQSCITGCKMKRYLKFCGCIPFYYPDSCINISQTCDMKDISCLKFNLDTLTKLNEDTKIDKIILPKCDCQPVCNVTMYSIFVDKNRLNHPHYVLPWKKNSSDEALSKLNIYFQDYGCTLYRRSLYMTWDGILANLGGLLGICLGGSLISLLEPIIHILLIPIRRWSYQRKMKIKQFQNKYQHHHWNKLKKLASARKLLFRPVKLDKKITDVWKENENRIFIITNNFLNENKQHQRTTRE